MFFPLPTSPTPRSGPSHRNRQVPPRQDNNQEVSNKFPADHKIAVTYKHLRTPEASPATVPSYLVNQEAMSLEIPAAGQYPTRLLPNPIKRKRYSVDEVTFKLDKVRVSKSGQAHINVIPPEDDSARHSYSATYRHANDPDGHLDDFYRTLSSDLQSSLHAALTRRSVSARKASDRIMREVSPTTRAAESLSSSTFDIISAVGSSIDILVLVGTHLRPRDILHLYSISRAFHTTLNTHMRSSVLVWAHHNCRLASEIFPYQFYVGATVPDPMGRPRDPAYHDIFARLTSFLPDTVHSSRPSSSSSNSSSMRGNETRRVPSLRWLQMVHARSTRVRDIVASLARRGHRLPPGSDGTLLKLWLAADLPTNVDRCAVVGSTAYFTRHDLYRSAVFLVKLLMRTNDPLYGPDHGVLMELMFGQRGLTPLWKLLRGKGFTTVREVVAAKMRYDVRPTVEERKKGLPVLGVPVEEMGRGHLEAWGKGTEHLLRVDELILRECARRDIEVDECVESMAVYGQIDIAKGEDLVPTLEELYMSDEEMPEELDREEDGVTRVLVHGGGGNVPFDDGEWNPKLVRKAIWDTLAEEVKQAIGADDRDEMLRALRWEEESRALSGEGSEEDGDTEENVEASDTEEQLLADIDKREDRGVLDDDSVLGGDSETDEGDILDEESVDDFYGSRVCSSNLPELSSRVCSSSNSLPVFTPPHEGSSDLVGIHDDEDVDVMNLDDENMDSTLLPSSLTATPLKFLPPQTGDSSGENEDSCDDDESEEELDDEERQRLAAERDEELLAQADQYYSEDELEYDWDAWKEQVDAVFGVRDEDNEDDEEEEDKKEYHRLY